MACNGMPWRAGIGSVKYPVLAVQGASTRRTQQQMTQHPHACCPLRAGFTGADLQNLMNEAAILAARRNLKEISKEEISDALERIVAGPEKKGAVMTEQKKRLVAYHEVRLSDRLSTAAPFLHANTQVVAAAYGSRLSVQAGHAGCAMFPVASRLL